MTEPGWFADPINPERLRYWNGQQWTDDIADIAPGHTRSSESEMVAPVSGERAFRLRGAARSSWLPILLVGGILVAAVLALGILHFRNPSRHDLSVEVTVGSFGDYGSVGNICWGKGDASQIKAGTDVTVKDGYGAFLASSTLAVGSVKYNSYCVLRAVIKGIPNASTYVVTVANCCSKQFAPAILDDDNWRIALNP